MLSWFQWSLLFVLFLFGDGWIFLSFDSIIHLEIIRTDDDHDSDEIDNKQIIFQNKKNCQFFCYFAKNHACLALHFFRPRFFVWGSFFKLHKFSKWLDQWPFGWYFCFVGFYFCFCSFYSLWIWLTVVNIIIAFYSTELLFFHENNRLLFICCSRICLRTHNNDNKNKNNYQFVRCLVSTSISSFSMNICFWPDWMEWLNHIGKYHICLFIIIINIL